MYRPTIRQQAIDDLEALPKGSPDCCWFCQQPLQEEINFINKHHLIPARYLRQRVLDWKIEKEARLIVKAHGYCHRQWHAQFDQWYWSYPEFLDVAHHFDFGFAVFATRRSATHTRAA